MDELVFFEGTVTRGGKRNRIVIYVPVEYHEKLERLVGKRLKLIGLVETGGGRLWGVGVRAMLSGGSR